MLQPLAIALVLAFAVRASSIGLYEIPSPSMEPTLQVGDTVLVTPYVSKNRPQRGDVVVFHSPATPDETVVKRVVGVPGDLVESRDGQLYVCGHVAGEPYARGMTTAIAPQVIAPNCYFVLGDNRANSLDSRIWGPVAADRVVGRVRVVAHGIHELEVVQ